MREAGVDLFLVRDLWEERQRRCLFNDVQIVGGVPTIGWRLFSAASTIAGVDKKLGFTVGNKKRLGKRMASLLGTRALLLGARSY